MSTRTRIELGRRADLGADCANCFDLCCVALAFTKSADFPFDKPAGDPCTNLDEHDGCRVHPQLRERGFKGCTVFDCFGAGQKVSRQTFAGRSWRDDPATREAMFSTFPLVRRLHELLWYLDEAITLVEREHERERTHDGEHAPAAAEHSRTLATAPDPAPWLAAFEHVRQLTDGASDELDALDVDAEYDAVRPLLVQASEMARASVPAPPRWSKGKGPTLEPGSDLMGAALAGADAPRQHRDRGGPARGRPRPVRPARCRPAGRRPRWGGPVGGDLPDADAGEQRPG
jgi:hypothetical protein